MRDMATSERKASGIPPIVGWTEKSFVEIMDEYVRNGAAMR